MISVFIYKQLSSRVTKVVF